VAILEALRPDRTVSNPEVIHTRLMNYTQLATTPSESLKPLSAGVVAIKASESLKPLPAGVAAIKASESLKSFLGIDPYLETPADKRFEKNAKVIKAEVSMLISAIAWKALRI
jgi:hypothetical protein